MATSYRKKKDDDDDDDGKVGREKRQPIATTYLKCAADIRKSCTHARTHASVITSTTTALSITVGSGNR